MNPPGEKFIYHIQANYWPMAIERITGKRLGEFVCERIADPLRLPDLRTDRRARSKSGWQT